MNWNLLTGGTQIMPIDPAVMTYSRNEDAAVAVAVTVSIEAFGSSRTGVGADVVALKDLDKAAKTAQAEAFKKAGHQYGVGLYLWDERERDLVDLVQKGAFKKAVALLAGIVGLPVEKEAIAEHFGADPSTDEGATEILTVAGLL